jgi:molecular chaperone DnaK (HSP70)
MPAKYAIGIDLGTTNSALAYVPLSVENAKVELLPIPQLVAPSSVESRPLLPSFLYLGTEQDTAAKSYDLPWAKKRDFAVGAVAQKQAADVPTRTVAAAKSWLAYSKADRHAPILPWNAPPEVAKVSPVEASKRYVEHLVAAWSAAFPKDPIAGQRVVLTVPASFDASARELTREAALAAGLPENLVLLEEPQAALYAWLADRANDWRKQLKVGETLLVCDVGGGTTDLTLIQATEENGELQLRRMAVGNHLLVGGDNMDLALAHSMREAFAQKGVELNPWQAVALWHSCRTAKETLLAEKGPKKHPVTVLGSGRRVIGGTISVDLERDAALKLLADGFFPACKLSDRPARQRASGFREIGLPYESDAAITRHLAEFLTVHGGDTGPVRPTHVLFNGGVFKADALRSRVLQILGEWFTGKAPSLLEGRQDLDFAVARGAAYYAAAKEGKGVRIRGGTARSYYVGIETAGLAIPGVPRPLRALCVVPFGMEEGTETDVPAGEIGLVVGEPTTFRFFSSAVRKEDKPGTILDRWKEDELAETDSLEASLPAAKASDDGYVPVRFHPKITELGVFELWCASTMSEERWKLEFSVREDAEKTTE